MTLMRLVELTRCPAHDRVVVVLEDAGRRRRLAFYADRLEAQRLARQVQRGPMACHPILDFIGALLVTWQASPVRVVLDDVAGQGITGVVCLRQGELELAVPCCPPDALALALRAGVPIYATEEALAHAETAARRGVPADGQNLAAWLDRLRPEDFAPGGSA
ncbi:MAG: DUF151 domain-containing protein [Candidatus Rokubacteria bacterium]|nr:DUF151 domain-containing protein [Candidatus Rokubacteria bacterium]